MKKFFIFISFIFIFLSCCFTSIELSEYQRPQISLQQLENSDVATVEKTSLTTDYYIVNSSQINLLQYLSSLFDNYFATIENNDYKKLNLYLVFTHWDFFSINTLKISCLLNPRAP